MLCEKPFSADPEAVRRAYAAAAAHDRLLMEAFMWRHSPLARPARRAGEERRDRAAELVLDGSHECDDRPGRPEAQPELEGGALADLGCYGVHAFRHLIGEPTRFAALAVVPGVDTSIAAALSTEAGELGQIICGFGLALQWTLRVVGDEGWFEMPDRWTGSSRVELHAAGGTTIERFEELDPYVDQLRNFTDAVAGAIPPLLGEDDAVAQAGALRRLRALTASGR